MQAGDVQLIIRSNLLWPWRLRSRCRKRSCRAACCWWSVLNDFLSMACEQTNQTVAGATNFPKVRLARYQIANVFEDGFAAPRDQQLRFFKTFSDTHTDS